MFGKMVGRKECFLQLENVVLPVNYAKTSITDAMAVKLRTPPNIHASFSSAPNKKMSDIVKSVWSFHAV